MLAATKATRTTRTLTSRALTGSAAKRPWQKRLSLPYRSLATTSSQVSNATVSYRRVNRSVKVIWSDGLDEKPNETQFAIEWLRDNCKCSQCIHPSNRQKLHSSADVVNTALEKVELRGNELYLVFNDGDKQHETTYDMDFLARYGSTKSMAKAHLFPESPVYWQGKEMSEKVKFIEYERYMHDDGALYEVLLELHRYGLVFLEGCPTENNGAGLADIAERIAHIKHTFYGRLWDVKSIPDAKNIAYTSLDLGLHMDLLYFADPPGLQFLQCLKNDATGGASYFCDSYNAAAELFQESLGDFRVLQQVPIAFHYDHKDHQMFHRHRTIVCESGGLNEQGLPVFSHVNYSPPFQAPLEVYTRADRLHRLFPSPLASLNPDAKPFVVDVPVKAALKLKTTRAFYNAFSKFAHKVNDKTGQFELTLKEGQCVIFNNRRVLHARREFDAGSGERWLKGTYIDQDAWRDKLMVMHKLRMEADVD